MESIQEKQNQIIDEFNFFQDWSEKYQYLIDLGKSLPDFDQNNRIDSNLINGCQSKVWLNSSFNDNIVIFEADSDAIISKGIISLLIRVFSGHNPKDILEANIDFIEKIGLNSHLSQTRANGLLSMIKQIKIYALAYQVKK
ncbi:MAG: SufE family protein [Flavobacteriaceae bacterium]|nr:SufE family protein [Flavobacteriaceae bacterium]MDA9882963.1 SufE family protein [Flavobacteriaceae bacterium]MDC1010467.1 SufE family protein [Flavobacteriaceae bacterium]MDC1034278.1 SufE family protein [Flavobacteriaceae bacterium]MDC3219048.1 SufE family protein [Flavobacteriaceae bacterium]